MPVLMFCSAPPPPPPASAPHYTPPHAPLAEKTPGMPSFPYRHTASLDGSQPPYYLIAELSFPSAEAMGASLGSPEAQAATADVPNFATGGVTMFVPYD